MSNLYQRRLSLGGINVGGLSASNLRSLLRQILEARIHGISFSPYVEGQGPGTVIGAEQIRERLSVIQPYTNWIRTFSCSEGNELIPAIAKKSGLKTLVGVWLDGNREQNETEMNNAIEIAQSGHADMLGVGNEVLLRGDLDEDDILDYIRRAREAAPDVPVGYVDAYFEFNDHPRIADACDVILANCYPFWESCPAEHALLYMKEMYRRAQAAAKGKKVVISETGWPNIGTAEGGAIPSEVNAIKYFIDTYRWAEEEGVEIFWFSSFDEAWKVDSEGDVGAYWGLWDKDGKAKYCRGFRRVRTHTQAHEDRTRQRDLLLRISRRAEPANRSLSGSKDQIREDLLILAPNWSYLRLYDCSLHAQRVLEIIREGQLPFKSHAGHGRRCGNQQPELPVGCKLRSRRRARGNRPVANLDECAASDCAGQQSLPTACSRYPSATRRASNGPTIMVPVDTLIEYVRRVRPEIDQPITFCDNYVPWLETARAARRTNSTLSPYIPTRHGNTGLSTTRWTTPRKITARSPIATPTRPWSSPRPAGRPERTVAASSRTTLRRNCRRPTIDSSPSGQRLKRS